MRQLKFMLDSDEMMVRMDLTPAEVKEFLPTNVLLNEYQKYGIGVGFDSNDLGEPFMDKSWWIVSDAAFPSTKQFEVRRFTLIGRAGWLSPEGKRYQGFSIQNEHLYVEVCTEWLEKLFGKVPQDLWFRRRAKPRA